MKRIDLKNGYAIDRPDPLNYALKEWKATKVKVKDSNGDFVRIKNEKGNTVIQTQKKYSWVTLGYYGRLKPLIEGMVEHKCLTEDCITLNELSDKITKFIDTIDFESLKSNLIE